MADNNNPLNGIDLDALASKYGDTPKDQTLAPSTNNGIPRITVYPQQLKGIDVDKLASKYGQEEPNNTEVELPQDEWWQQPAKQNGLLGIGERFGVGVLRGAKTVADTLTHGAENTAAYAANKFLPSEIADPISQYVQSDIAKDVAGRDLFNKTYDNSPSANIGQTVGSIIATAPLMPAKLFTGIDAAANALPVGKVAAPLVNRLASSVAKGAIGGGVYGAATASGNDNSVGENVGENAVTGALAGPILTGVGDTAKALGSKALGSISATTAQLAKRAEELGIPLKATQVSNSPLLKKFDQISGMLPFSGAQGITDNQTSAFTRAVSRTFGENTDEITPKVIANAREKIGTKIENVGRNATIKADKDLGDDLTQIVRDAYGTMTEQEMRPVAQNIQNIIDKIDKNGNISGEAYTALTNFKAVLSKAQNNTNPNIKHSANQIRTALDDALTRSIPSDQKDALLAARSQYKSVMTIKDLAEADEHGNVSPLRLMQKVMKSPGGKLRSGDLGELADIGRAFFKQPSDSGTPLGEAVMRNVSPFLHSPVSAGIAGLSSVLSGASLGTVGEGAVGLAANRAIRSAINSNAARRAIIRSGMGETHGITNKLSSAIVPYSAALTPKSFWKDPSQNSK